MKYSDPSGYSENGPYNTSGTLGNEYVNQRNFEKAIQTENPREYKRYLESLESRAVHSKGQDIKTIDETLELLKRAITHWGYRYIYKTPENNLPIIEEASIGRGGWEGGRHVNILPSSGGRSIHVPLPSGITPANLP